MRLILFGLAWLFVLIGVIGTVVPVLPTTPFLLLAAALFARSSPRFEQWLLDHPRFGGPLLDWRREGAISKKAKITAVCLMLVSYGVVWTAGPAQLWVKLLIGAILGGSAAFVLTRPSPKTDEQTVSK